MMTLGAPCVPGGKITSRGSEPLACALLTVGCGRPQVVGDKLLPDGGLLSVAAETLSLVCDKQAEVDASGYLVDDTLAEADDKSEEVGV